VLPKLNIYKVKDSTMKLQDLATIKPTRQASRVLESHFNAQIDFDRLRGHQARTMLKRVRRMMQEHRQTTARHFSEQEPAYLKLVMMEQGLAARVKEEMVTIKSQPAKPPVGTTKQVKVEDPKLAAALKKQQAGGTLTKDESDLVAQAALAQTESRLRHTMGRFKKLTESEVQQAQVVLAAQDMVDNIQAMIEDATEMQFKELPALVDSIRNQIGMEQAVQFQQDATAALSGLVQNLQGTKTSLEQGLGVVTGQSQGTAAIDAAMGTEPPEGAEAPLEPAVDGEEEIDLSLDANLDEPEEEPGTGPALGRERR